GRRLDERAGVGVEREGPAGLARLRGQDPDDVDQTLPALLGEAGSSGVIAAGSPSLAAATKAARRDEDVAAGVVEQREPLAADLEGVVRRAVLGDRQLRVDLRQAEVSRPQLGLELVAEREAAAQLDALESQFGAGVEDDCCG